mmetsp:Transcript_133/g.1027  ORF Transcript_133/g.1027 Transcript_133/m.1027 type:complete len:116 (-) Transcript_133:618-965(-)
MHAICCMINMVAMRQLSHFVFMTCSSSCKRNLVEATELAKQHQVSKQRQQEGHDDSPHFPLQGMYPAQQVYLSMSPYSALFLRMKLAQGEQNTEKQQNLQSLQGARKRSVCQLFR